MNLSKKFPKRVTTFSGFSEIPKEDFPIFEKALKAEYSESTKKAIVFDIHHFLQFQVKKYGSFSLNKVTKQDLKEYQDYCRNELKHSVWTVKRKNNSLKILYMTGISLGKIKSNPILIS